MHSVPVLMRQDLSFQFMHQILVKRRWKTLCFPKHRLHFYKKEKRRREKFHFVLYPYPCSRRLCEELTYKLKIVSKQPVNCLFGDNKGARFQTDATTGPNANKDWIPCFSMVQKLQDLGQDNAERRHANSMLQNKTLKSDFLSIEQSHSTNQWNQLTLTVNTGPTLYME